MPAQTLAFAARFRGFASVAMDRIWVRVLICGIVLLQPVSAPSATGSTPTAGPARHCVMAARRAANTTGVPLDVLDAISLVETGRGTGTSLEPWPWTVNMEGAGHWFPSEQTARAFVFENFRRGARSFDVGCFQINYKWHGAQFASIEQMFDPLENALYAARFLRQLHAELGSWTLAAGAYHSRTPELARSYAVRFDTVRAALGRPQERDGNRNVRHGNGFAAALPLLAGEAARLGSLVPRPQHSITARRALIAVP